MDARSYMLMGRRGVNVALALGANALWSPVTSPACTGRRCINLARPGFNDLYGGGVTGTSPNAADPTRVAAGLQFDGVDDIMIGADGSLDTLYAADAVSVFALATFDTGTFGHNAPYLASSQSRVQPAVHNHTFQFFARNLTSDTAGAGAIAVSNVSQTIFYGGVVNYSAQTILGLRNATTNTTLAGILTVGPTGNNLCQARTHTGGNPLKGTLYAFGYFKRALTLAEFAQIAAYYRGVLVQFGVTLP